MFQPVFFWAKFHMAAKKIKSSGCVQMVFLREKAKSLRYFEGKKVKSRHI
jgi:hypothetical protein